MKAIFSAFILCGFFTVQAQACPGDTGWSIRPEKSAFASWGSDPSTDQQVISNTDLGAVMSCVAEGNRLAQEYTHDCAVYCGSACQGILNFMWLDECHIISGAITPNGYSCTARGIASLTCRCTPLPPQ